MAIGLPDTLGLPSPERGGATAAATSCLTGRVARHRARQAAGIGEPQSSQRRLRVGPESGYHPQVGAPGCPGARLPAAGGANDYGPPRMPGTSELSVPSVGGPIDCPSRSCPGARDGGGAHGRGSGEYPTRGRADELAAGASMPSGASVLRRQRNGEPLPALLPSAGQHRPTPAGGHPRAKPMLVDAAFVPRTIRWLHPENPPK